MEALNTVLVHVVQVYTIHLGLYQFVRAVDAPQGFLLDVHALIPALTLYLRQGSLLPGCSQFVFLTTAVLKASDSSEKVPGLPRNYRSAALHAKKVLRANIHVEVHISPYRNPNRNNPAS